MCSRILPPTPGGVMFYVRHKELHNVRDKDYGK